MPEHTYYSDAPDLKSITNDIERDLAACGFADQVRILPGIRLLRRPASTLKDRGDVLQKSNAVGYWMYELADLQGKTPIEFEGALADAPEKYVSALHEMNASVETF